ncbi:alpha-1,2-fucosyltransferase [Oryzomonas japonica]|uniref:Alpha-1,2-fucosyltransferase n=1 Tax=Oryzomonas japonica TaxID=2603858 RepID=A0A7J4ZSG5_9BACT|nr:alpha-1,2-fucosyltransferase [Oryzomonas japonica]KAB0666162.1 alpha-1,2-fucosyltransferase [Oryzomonas japonica]
MIIVKLWGGLGNQMFQYAAARRLAHINGDRLKLDTQWFGREARGDTPRRYELGVFDITADIATAEEVRRLRGVDTRRWPKAVKRLLASVGYATPISYVAEQHFNSAPEILSLKGDIYLDGYWQSEKYFRDTADVIRNDFRLKESPDGANASVLREIKVCESVSLHFRRGDYVTNSNAAAYHGVLSLDYYAAAIEAIGARVASPRFFVFSDDLTWVKHNFKIDFPVTYIDVNGAEKAYDDLRLMSACQHHIIANSSFSWWGAWLNKNSKKIVVAPQKWYSATEINSDDLIPDAWLRI